MLKIPLHPQLVWRLTLLFNISQLFPGVAASQCSMLVDNLVGVKYDYLHRYGLAISLQESRRMEFHCIPERRNRLYPDIACFWRNNEKDYSKTGLWAIFKANGCILDSLVGYDGKPTPEGNTYNNFTCVTKNEKTGERTIMTYLVYFLSNKFVTGIPPYMSEGPLAKQAELEDTVSELCEADISQTSSVVDLNWYLLNEDGSRQQVTRLSKHSVSACGMSRNKKVARLTLTIAGITKDMLDKKYECIASKVDVWSAYNQTISSYKLHSANILDNVPRGIMLVPNITSRETLKYYDNDTEGVCTLTKPCTANVTFHLQSPIVHTEHMAVFIALAVVGILAILTIVAITILAIRRIPIHNHLKHRWAITRDVVNPSYKHQVIIFYAERCTSEELFVQNHLLVKLENQWKYKTLVPQRDYLIGASKAQECVDSLDSSQKVIFLLTEAMFTQEWKIYALDVALKEHRKIIIIKREEIDFQSLLENYGKKFSEVESALKVSAVIDWNKHKHKWKRLHLELPVVVNQTIKHRLTYRLREFLKLLNMW